MRRSVAVVTVGLALLVAACGGGGGDPEGAASAEEVCGPVVEYLKDMGSERQGALRVLREAANSGDPDQLEAAQTAHLQEAEARADELRATAASAADPGLAAAVENLAEQLEEITRQEVASLDGRSSVDSEPLIQAGLEIFGYCVHDGPPT